MSIRPKPHCGGGDAGLPSAVPQLLGETIPHGFSPPAAPSNVQFHRMPPPQWTMMTRLIAPGVPALAMRGTHSRVATAAPAPAPIAFRTFRRDVTARIANLLEVDEDLTRVKRATNQLRDLVALRSILCSRLP